MSCFMYLLLVHSLYAVGSAQKGNGKPATGAWKGIKLVDAGLSRTGTESLTAALQTLGYNPSHGEQFKVFPKTLDIVDAQMGNFTGVYSALAAERKNAAFDAPLNAFAQRYVKDFDAKVLLSVHPGGADGWVDSVQHFTRFWQIFSAYPAPKFWSPANGSVSCVIPVSPTLVIDKPLREACKKAYNDYNARVMKQFSSDRLLVYNIVTHWGPLCKFLGKKVPMKNGKPIHFPHIDNVVAKINSLKLCGFCGNALVNGHKPTASDIKLIPEEVYTDK